MRLLNTTTLCLEAFVDDIPPYAILSHTWEKEEILFEDLQKGRDFWRHKKGASKVEESARTAREHDCAYIWIDTCCIDKSSSAELSEAINTMFKWYTKAFVCFAYLADVPHVAFEESRWYTRGWTLQETVAPSEIFFFDYQWNFIGTRSELAEAISRSTSISQSVLAHSISMLPFGMDWSTDLSSRLRECTIHTKMRWAANRETTRAEDMAYCLLGLFDVHMSLLYGEGAERAFARLQKEIMKVSDDQSILLHVPELRDPVPRAKRWAAKVIEPKPSNIFAKKPSQFLPHTRISRNPEMRPRDIQPTRGGLILNLFVCPTFQDEHYTRTLPEAIGILNFSISLDSSLMVRPAIPLRRLDDGWVRCDEGRLYFVHPGVRGLVARCEVHSCHVGEWPDWQSARQLWPSCRFDMSSAQAMTIELHDPDSPTRKSSRRDGRIFLPQLRLGKLLSDVHGLSFKFGPCYPSDTEEVIALDSPIYTIERPGVYTFAIPIYAVIWVEQLQLPLNKVSGRSYPFAILVGKLDKVDILDETNTWRCLVLASSLLFPELDLTLDAPELTNSLSLETLVDRIKKADISENIRPCWVTNSAGKFECMATEGGNQLLASILPADFLGTPMNEIQLRVEPSDTPTGASEPGFPGCPACSGYRHACWACDVMGSRKNANSWRANCYSMNRRHYFGDIESTWKGEWRRRSRFDP